MIVHVFNSSVVSGPETLVIPALKQLGGPVTIVFLTENRLGARCQAPIDYAKSFGHRVIEVPVRGRWDTHAFHELRRVLDEMGPSLRIVHAHDVKASLYVQRARASEPGFLARVVSTHHGTAARHGVNRLYEEYYVRWVLPHFDRVLCVCSNDLRSVVKRGISEAAARMHLNGVDRNLVDPNDRALVARAIRWGWKSKNRALPDPDKAIFVGAVSRLSHEKRHDRMVRVFSELKKIRDPLGENALRVVLLCFGSGVEEARIRELAASYGVEDRVFLMGYSKTISSEMAGFDLLLSMSDGEGIPISLLEAGWAGTPVFSTKVGGIPDLIASPRDGNLNRRRGKRRDLR